jgi:outer membrane receptor for ferrienterochelin and colicins
MKVHLTLAMISLTISLNAQTISGKLFGKEGKSKDILPGGTVRWINAEAGTVANENGVFELSTFGVSDKRLVASAIGYISDTVTLNGKTYISIILEKDAQQLATVTITDRKGAYISNLSVNQAEVINQRELTKAACCDLAGCFGTQASVQPQTTNVVTNAQELRILGLSGVYNQVLFDGMPMIQGLTYTYGISSYPGTIVNKIFVSKGTNSVLQGYESISGQINLVPIHPDNTDRLFVNGYINSFGEKQENLNLSSAIGKKKKWHTLLAVHAVQPAGRIDGNDDGFLDLPLLTRYMAYNKWKYGDDTKEGFAFQVGLRIVDEKRVGGQVNYDASQDSGSSTIYGQSVKYTQPEAYVKSAYRISDDHTISLMMSGFGQQQTSWFGTTSYNAKQVNGYINLQHEWLWKDKHLLKYGASYRLQELNETVAFADTTLKRTYAGKYETRLYVPGFFAENTFHWNADKFVLITGIRTDHHQRWGWFVTPRGMLKWNINSKNTLRSTVGSGWRQVNLFSEQVNLLASSRDIVFAETLKPETAVNWGFNHTFRFEVGEMTGTLSEDFYNTYFTNQSFPDYDADPTKAIIRNFTGVSQSNGLQMEASLNFFKQIAFRVAYNYLDVYRIQNGSKVLLPFNPTNRAMSALSYSTKNKHWQADINAHWFDKMRLPDRSSSPVEFQRPAYSTPYTTFNVQLTFKWKTLDLYTGCENVGNYRQLNPIISADNPFGQYFDLSSVWGPTRGREVYFGVRYSIK